jgi:hypothetical protein
VDTIHSECVFTDSVTQHAGCLCPVILSSVASPAWQHFFLHYLMNGAIFGKTFLNITYVFAFSVSHSKENSATPSSQAPVILVIF